MTNHKIYTLLITITSIVQLSCSEKVKVLDASLPPTTEELLDSLGGFSFSIKVPSDIEKEQFAGLGIVGADGVVKTFSSTNGHEAGDVIRYICYHPKNGVFRYSYTNGREHKGAGESSNFPKTVDSNGGKTNSIFMEGERIMRYSEDSSMHLTGSPVDDDFDLIFHVEK